MPNTSEELWKSISDWYADFATDPGREYFHNMVVFIERLRAHPDFDQFRPSKSMAMLLVAKHDGYQPDKPFVSIHAEPDGTFALQFNDRVLRPRGSPLIRNLDQALEAFSQMAASI